MHLPCLGPITGGRCRLSRNGTATGRKRARPFRPEARATVAVAAPPPPVLAVAPRGAPSAPDTQVLTVQVWWDNLLEEVRSAVQVVIASFVYDNAALTDLLVRRLADRSAFDLTVLVDKERFEERECRGERPSLQRLQRAGAEVFLCRGYVPLKSREG